MGLLGPNVKKLEAKGDIVGLIKIFPKKDFHLYPEVKEAIDALVRIGEPAVGPLIQAMRVFFDRDFLWSARNVFAGIGQPSVRPVIAELGSDDYRVREAAADVLAHFRVWESREIDVPEAVKPLLDAWKREVVWETKRQLTCALVAVGGEGFRGLFEHVVTLMQRYHRSRSSEERDQIDHIMYSVVSYCRFYDWNERFRGYISEFENCTDPAVKAWHRLWERG